LSRLFDTDPPQKQFGFSSGTQINIRSNQNLPFDLAPASLSVSHLGFAGFGFLAIGSSEKVATTS
jgi:hypothetical protein